MLALKKNVLFQQSMGAYKLRSDEQDNLAFSFLKKLQCSPSERCNTRMK